MAQGTAAGTRAASVTVADLALAEVRVAPPRRVPRPLQQRRRIGVLTPFAVGLSALGALLVAAGPRYVVARSASGIAVGPALSVWPLLAVLAVVPAVLVVMLLLARRHAPALAVVASVGAIAAGRALLDAQLVRNPGWAARPELVAPVGLGQLRPDLGAWLLVAGQLTITLGGLAAARAIGARAGERTLDEPPAVPRTPSSAVLLGVGCSLLAGIGVLAAPFVSADPHLVPRSVLDAPSWAAAGGYALAAAIVLSVVLACSTADPQVAVGGLVGAAIGVLGVAAPRVAVAALSTTQRVAIGPTLALLGALGLAALATWVGCRGRRPVMPKKLDRLVDQDTPVVRAALAMRWRQMASRLGMLAGGCAIAAALTDPLWPTADVPDVELPIMRLLLAVGLVLVLLGAVTGTGSIGPTVRPTLAVVLVAVPMVAVEPLADLLAVLGWMRPGPGFWLLLVAIAVAAGAALASVIAGGFDRDEVDLSAFRFHPVDASVAWAGAMLAVPAFWLPLVNGAGWGTTGVLQPPFGLASWGLLAAFGATVGALILAPGCRPRRAVALYGGVALVLLLRLARLAPAPGPGPVGPGSAGPGEGTWATVLCLLFVSGSVVLALRLGPFRAIEPGPEPRFPAARRQRGDLPSGRGVSPQDIASSTGGRLSP
jgi:hypothetical protein